MSTGGLVVSKSACPFRYEPYAAKVAAKGIMEHALCLRHGNEDVFQASAFDAQRVWKETIAGLSARAKTT